MAGLTFPPLGIATDVVSEKEPNPEDIAEYTVQDRHASYPEYLFARALDALGLEYAFQAAVLGGKLLLGGMVIDFVVDTPPLPTPVWVNGRYWHSGAEREKDIFQQAVLESIMRGEFNPAVEVWDDEIPTFEDALRIARERIL